MKYKIRQKNKTSGKAGGRFIAFGMEVSDAKKICDAMDAAHPIFKHHFMPDIDASVTPIKPGPEITDLLH